MVDVDVNVQDPWVVFEELEDREDDVVDVAKARGFVLLGVVQTARPVDNGVRLPAGRDVGFVQSVLDRQA